MIWGTAVFITHESSLKFLPVIVDMLIERKAYVVWDFMNGVYTSTQVEVICLQRLSSLGTRLVIQQCIDVCIYTFLCMECSAIKYFSHRHN